MENTDIDTRITKPMKPNRTLTPIRTILVSQPKPLNSRSPYYDLVKKYNIKIDFKPFIEVKSISMAEFREQKVNISDYTAIVFTSRRAIDHFFEICKNIKTEITSEVKYFCISEQTATYLHKYIVVRKRKVFSGRRTSKDLIEVLKNHKKEKFLFPCSDVRKEDIPNFLKKKKYRFKELVIYHTVSADLSKLANINYDMIAFFSPSGVESLFKNFPNFKQKSTRIASFGPTTAKSVIEKKLTLHIEAPLPNAPSMTGAIELYIQRANKVSSLK